MNASDRERFAKAMARVMSIYKDTLTSEQLDVWFGVLLPYEIQAIREALNFHVSDPEKGSYPPRPADIIKHLKFSVPRARRDKNRDFIREQNERIYEYEKKITQATGDMTLGLKTPEEGREAIQNALNGIRQIKDQPEYQKYLSGFKPKAESMPDVIISKINETGLLDKKCD